MPKKPAKEMPVCSSCKSADVLADAYAVWDHKLQDWALQGVYERGAWCNACEGETSLDWRED